MRLTSKSAPAILAEKNEDKVNQDESLTDLQTLIKYSFLLNFLHESLMNLIKVHCWDNMTLIGQSAYNFYLILESLHTFSRLCGTSCECAEQSRRRKSKTFECGQYNCHCVSINTFCEYREVTFKLPGTFRGIKK